MVYPAMPTMARSDLNRLERWPAFILRTSGLVYRARLDFCRKQMGFRMYLCLCNNWNNRHVRRHMPEEGGIGGRMGGEGVGGRE